ncbi:hypothetical protein THAOC_18573 [Thalassiosira oceanica]|uniref:Glycosyl transferase CAP10 domain-containing protein n=1 Tax=Thalassiosira oceanica TaxID=159749 RepID=K0SRP3_THAOC|nr:hypothetical protein THAOC_18573 [Thalassiosira oceanica]|eukprot:EJK61002.1 hypothetical protein THAOC_18573 [Thalassiosira oceanica]
MQSLFDPRLYSAWEDGNFLDVADDETLVDNGALRRIYDENAEDVVGMWLSDEDFIDYDEVDYAPIGDLKLKSTSVNEMAVRQGRTKQQQGGGSTVPGSFSIQDIYHAPADDQLPPREVSQYTIIDAMGEVEVFQETFALLVYDPPNDRFVGLYSRTQKWAAGNDKLWKSYKSFCRILRKTFPERFTPQNDELVIAMSGGDYPHVKLDKLPHLDGVAPVLMFGSAFRDPNVYKNMITMPMPHILHLYCMEHYATYGTVCSQMSNSENGADSRAKHFRKWDKLKAIVLSEEAVVEVNRFHLTKRPEPWADMRFSSFFSGRKVPTVGNPTYSVWEEVGIATGDGMSLDELSLYRYHIDLGGGGGTTWTGTIEKLLMPGLLMHHLTPTADYIHEWIKPWEHYVPVSSHLRDLKQKFRWAEAHPNQAKRMSYRATQLARYLGSEEGYAELFERSIVEPARRVIDAYQPISATHPGMTWQQLVQSHDRSFSPVIECMRHGTCSQIREPEVREWQRGHGRMKCQDWPGGHTLGLRRFCDDEQSKGRSI